MCTVVIRVPQRGPLRVLAIRDEDPQRPWRPVGAWWPDRPTVRGIMDELAGGAWMAADGSTFAVLLNRAGGHHGPDVTSRDARRIWKQLGTLGGGNHFIELCLDESGAVWIMLHSGSRPVVRASRPGRAAPRGWSTWPPGRT